MTHPKPVFPRIAPAAPDHPTLPANRAFVVQLRADADPARGVFVGRVEHMASGVASLFDSVEQLAGCMRDAVARGSSPPARGDEP